MEANPVRIVQYFDGEKQSIIPLFQRPYTWNKRNWEALWNDIMVYYDDNLPGSHFMGAVVSIPARSVPVGVTKHLVIDGQQRLTTIALMMCSLRDCCSDRRSAQIQDYLINRHYENKPDYFKLLPTQSDRDAYMSIIKGERELGNKHLMVECYDFFIKALQGIDENNQKIDAEKILEIVKSQLQVVMINLGETDDPYLIFESLNFKGEPLSQADLIRNYILMRFNSSLSDGGDQEKVYRELWNPMESRLEKSLEDFLWHYAIKDGDNIKKPKVYSSFKGKLISIKNQSDLKDYVFEMSKASINYVRFLCPEKEANHQIKKELALLDRLEATISYPILIKLFSACDNKQIDDDVLLRCLRHINSFIVRRTVCNEKRSALNKLFANIASRIPSNINEIDEWIASELVKRVRSERWPNDAEFKNAMLNNNLYNTKAARIVLDGIESLLAGKEVVDLSSSKITVEHIMPQTLDLDWKQNLDHDEEGHVKYVDKIGNLTLSALNSELGNKSFSMKRDIYLKSGISMNRDIATREKWAFFEIQKRSEFLADHAIKLWPMPLV